MLIAMEDPKLEATETSESIAVIHQACSEFWSKQVYYKSHCHCVSVCSVIIGWCIFSRCCICCTQVLKCVHINHTYQTPQCSSVTVIIHRVHTLQVRSLTVVTLTVVTLTDHMISQMLFICILLDIGNKWETWVFLMHISRKVVVMLIKLKLLKNYYFLESLA